MKMQAAIAYGPGKQLSIETVDLAEPHEREVLVKIIASGVCHTDLSARDSGLAPFPAVLGHEGAGIVEKTGSGVTGLRAGDHVVLSYAHCGHCAKCLSGQPAECRDFSELNFDGRMEDGTTRLSQEDQEISNFFGQSAFGTFAVVSERNAIKVDPELRLEVLAPLGCGIQTGSGTVLNLFKPVPGSAIAVFGSGSVGLGAVMAAKIAGCEKIIAVDVHDNRLHLAKDVGATHVLNSADIDLVKEIKSLTGGKGTHYAFDTTANSAIAEQAIKGLRPNGQCVMAASVGLPYDVMKEAETDGKSVRDTIQGGSVSKEFIPKLVDYYKNGLLPMEKLITYYDFEQINQAFEDSENGLTIKPVIVMPK